MKKLLFLFSFYILLMSVALAQDNTYYTDDESTVTEKAQDAPPVMPDYTQPPCPGDGYLWTPGYWFWGAAGWFWVPGVWVMSPAAGLLWTPGYWGGYQGYWGWHQGYWGPYVGYYGGINYGFGYWGTGFYGGRWNGGVFLYNTAVWRVGGGVHNVYVDRTVVRNVGGIRASFNGLGGVKYRPGAEEIKYMHENHIERSSEQVAHHQAAASDRGQVIHDNSRPAYHSMDRPGGQHFNARGRAVGGGGGRRR